MALGISARHEEFDSAVAQVDAAAERLRTHHDRVARQVETLLDGGWRGTAASAYAEGWDVWRSGAQQVLDGLVAMGRLLDAADARFVGSDDTAEASVARLAARLGR